MRRFLLVTVIAILCLSPLTAATPAPTTQPTSSKVAAVIDHITVPLLRAYLSNLTNFGSRVTGTYACQLAGTYIHDQFISDGLQTRYQNWTMRGDKYFPQKYSASNVEATLPGTDPNDDSIIIFNAHYDNAHQSVGGNDDGSGTAAVLAAAYALSFFHFNRTIRLVTFAGEEEGLLGSRAYTKEIYTRGDDILVEFNADMVGHTETTAGAHAARLSLSEDAGFAATLVHQVNAGYIDFTLTDRNITNRIQKKWGGSDYAPFINDGWETIGVWEADGDPNMHTPQDDMTNVNLDYLTNMTRLIAGSLAAIADATPVPPQVRLVSPQQGTRIVHGRYAKDIDERKTVCINDVWLYATVFHPSAPILKVEFYMDGKLVNTDMTAPYSYHLQKRSLRDHTFVIIAYDTMGRTTSDTRVIHYINLLLKR
jgi:hypothetical protein